ncbi:hypothetical protein ORIO_02125 [Cereibacter azotoformans]|uniref:hypothetical protein n=1 Tax=Cereibacter azotoformans TaxID=43057 RepID=UPI0005C521D9|nr:hypothetical protein [Cereibacter azotoformans]ULB08733.1 hypothetical protein ORIO_02125 [Cereibacter azotoformans]
MMGLIGGAALGVAFVGLRAAARWFVNRFLLLVLPIIFVAAPGLAQSDCAARTFGQIGCENRSDGHGLRQDDDFGRGGAWSRQQAQPEPRYYGAQPYDPAQQNSYNDDYRGTLRGGSSRGCGTLLSGPCN